MTLLSRIHTLKYNHEKRTGEEPDFLDIPWSLWSEFWRETGGVFTIQFRGGLTTRTVWMGMEVRWSVRSVVSVSHRPTWP